MKSTTEKLIYLVLLFVCVGSVSAEQTVSTVKVKQAPVIDGVANDSAWSQAKEVITHDSVANVDIRIKTVYTNDEIFFLIHFPDSSESRNHKNLQWDKKSQLYKIGPSREDTVVLKWNMEPFPVDITLGSDNTYKADIWYWKSFRTDHAGYADDKHQIYSDKHSSKAHRVISKTGKTFYLTRKGDKGQSAYKNNIPVNYQGEVISGYKLRKPAGSRADIKAKGNWDNGSWTIELSRKLNTTNNDDVYLEPGLSYRFGVSRYEIAGRTPNPNIEIPLFGSGEISEYLLLEFK